MKWLGRGAAFRTGMVLAPAILWTIVVVAGMVFLGVVTHLFWILSVLGQGHRSVLHDLPFT